MREREYGVVSVGGGECMCVIWDFCAQVYKYSYVCDCTIMCVCVYESISETFINIAIYNIHLISLMYDTF